MPRVSKPKAVNKIKIASKPKVANRAKVVAKIKVNDSGAFVMPELNPRDPDVTYLGTEPLFNQQPSEDDRQLMLIRGFNWYTHFYDRKMAKQQLIAYADYNKIDQIKLLQLAEDREYVPAICWLARMSMRGLVLLEREQTLIAREITRVCDTVMFVAKQAEDTVIKSNRPNVQEIMRERAQEAAGELEGMFDSFIVDGKPEIDDLNIVNMLAERKIMPQHISAMIDAWTDRKTEFENAQNKSDSQLTEGYSQYTRSGLKGLIKFCDAILAGLSSYVTVKKAFKAPRKKRAVSPEKQVAKIKFLRTFKDDALKIDLVSLHPAKLIGATECFLYDTAKRRLTYYVVDSHAGSLSVKGTTILGFDAVKSQVKTIRKPDITLSALIKAGKPAARKVFADLTTVGTVPNGRTNENTVILRIA